MGGIIRNRGKHLLKRGGGEREKAGLRKGWRHLEGKAMGNEPFLPLLPFLILFQKQVHDAVEA
jgi:hypothetical protein